MDKLSYSLGLNIGQQLQGPLTEQGILGQINADDFAAGIADLFARRQLRINPTEAQQLLDRFFSEQQSRKASAATMTREAGERFLAANARKYGVVTLPSGLQYEVLKEGTGRKPTVYDTVRCHYHGTLTDAANEAPARRFLPIPPSSSTSSSSRSSNYALRHLYLIKRYYPSSRLVSLFLLFIQEPVFVLAAAVFGRLHNVPVPALFGRYPVPVRGRFWPPQTSHQSRNFTLPQSLGLASGVSSG